MLKETVSPKKALEVAIHMEMGTQNQQKIDQTGTLMSNFQGNTDAINNFQGRSRNTKYQ